MKTIKIAKGNAFDLVVPLVLINDTIDPTKISDLQAIVKTSKGDAVECTIAADSNNAVITFADLLGLGSYDVQIYGKYNTRKFAILFNNCFAIAEWSNGCNYDYKITPEIVVTDPQPLVGWYATDAELDQLKADYLAAIQAEQAAAEELQEKVQMLDGVAQQGNDPTATNSEILYQITHLVVPPPTGVAQQDTLTQGIADIRGDIAGIDIDTSTIAKQGSNASATLTDTQAAVKDGNDTAVGVAKEIRSELGTGSDTAAETGTLFAVVKWIKDKVKSIFNSIGTPASGQASTLFGAIANINIDTTTIAKQGSNANANISDIQSAVGTLGTNLQSMANSWAAVVTNRSSLAGYTFGVGEEIRSVGDLIARFELVTSINDSTITAISQQYSFVAANAITIEMANLEEVTGTNALSGVSKLSSVSFPKLTRATGAYFLSNNILNEIELPMLEIATGQRFLVSSSLLVSARFPKLTSSLASYSLQNTPLLEELYVPKCTGLSGTNSLTQCTKLIDLTIGDGANANLNISAWNPTEALLTNNSSLVKDGETFANNREKLLYKIREHIAANLPNRTGLSALTLTVNANIKSAINGDTATAQAFANKNWTIA